jgi:hypothetical protein
MSAVNPVLQDTDTLWLKRRVGGASISTLQDLDIDITAYDMKENQMINNQMIEYPWSYIIAIIIIVIIIVYLLNQWKSLVSKKHSRRKRTISRIRRAIQAIAIRRIHT